MRRVAVIALIGGLASQGCLYLSSIDQRPSVQIVQDSTGEVNRGEKNVLFHAEYDDPDGDDVEFQWQAFACANGTDFATCDPKPVYTGTTETAQFDAPSVRVDPDNPTGPPLPAAYLWLELDATDARGASAKPQANKTIPLNDGEPQVVVRAAAVLGTAVGGFATVGTPVDIYATVTDADDPVDTLSLTWTVTGTDQNYQSMPLDIAQDPEHPEERRVGMRLWPSKAGGWEVDLTAKDPADRTGTGSTDSSFYVVDDYPPCLAQVDPIVPPASAALPLSDPTRFQVLVVNDDLDSYPPRGDNALFGTTTFQWWIKRPTDTGHVKIENATASSYDLDPASFAPGDTVELRVEIADRAWPMTKITCTDGDPTCSVISTDLCIQRQTWTVSVQ